MSDVLSYILHFKSQIKLLHWTTLSYDRHRNYDRLHERFDEASDRFVEVFLGKYGRQVVSLGAQRSPALVVHNKNTERDFAMSTIASCIEFFIKINPTYIKDRDFELLNIRDEILSILYQSKYLLELH